MIEKKEQKKSHIFISILFHFVVLLLIGILIYLPMYKKKSATPKHLNYVAVHGLFPDYYNYLSIIKQGADRFYYEEQYSTEPNLTSRAHMFYLLAGRVGKYLKLDPIEIYHSSIVISLLIFYLFAVYLCNLFFSGKYARLSLLMIFFAGPFPTQAIKIRGKEYLLGTDWWTRWEVHHRLYLVPHHMFALAMMAAVVYFFVRFLKSEKVRYLAGAVFFQILSAFFFPIPSIIVVFSLGIFLMAWLFKMFLRIVRHKKNIRLIIKKNIKISAGCVLLMGITVVVWYLAMILLGLSNNAVVSWEYDTYRGEVYPYTFWVFARSMGILLPFFIISPIALIYCRKKEVLFILILAAAPFILYLLSYWGLLHINKIRFVYANQYLFFSIMIVVFISVFFSRIKNTIIYRPAVISIIGLIFTISVLSAYFNFRFFLKPDVFFINWYIPYSHAVAMDYLNKNTPRFSHVLTNYADGSYLPAFTYNKVYMGHEVSTQNFWPKFAKVNRFFDGGMSEDEARQLFKEGDIDYIFYSIHQPNPKYSKLAKEVFRDNYVAIYKIIK